jgi:hypothetical protein
LKRERAIFLEGMANKPSSNGIFFSKPWRERPWWSRWNDIVNGTIVGIIMVFVLWEAIGRWLGY